MAALGDGIIAGKGAMADNLADMTIEYKGVSFATGNIQISNSLVYSLVCIMEHCFGFLKISFSFYFIFHSNRRRQ